MTINDIVNILNNGKISPLCTECCPCGDLYVFASVDTYLTLNTAFGWSENSKDCTSGTAWQLPCCTDDCLDKIGSFAGKVVVDTIMEKGFVEYSLLGGKSMLCTIYDFLVQNNLTSTEAATAVGNLLDAGVVYQCIRDENLTNGDGSKTIVASVETYLNYAEAEELINTDCQNTPCQCLPEPCCFTVKGNVDTYLQYLGKTTTTTSSSTTSTSTSTSTTTSTTTVPPNLIELTPANSGGFFGLSMERISGVNPDNLVFSMQIDAYATSNCTGGSGSYSFNPSLDAGESFDFDGLMSIDPTKNSAKIVSLTVTGGNVITTSPQTITVNGTNYIIEGFNVCTTL